MEHAAAKPDPDAGQHDQRGQRLGSLIGGVFGLIYVGINAGALTAPAAAALRIAGAVVFAGLVALLAAGRGPGAASAEAETATRGGFGPRYWLIVAAEVAGFLVGSALLNGPLDLPRAVVAWVSVVVGVHFFALAALWRVSLFRWLGAAITLCGLAGLIAAGLDASDAVIATLGGVLPGALLLAAGYTGAIAALRTAPPRRVIGGTYRAYSPRKYPRRSRRTTAERSAHADGLRVADGQAAFRVEEVQPGGVDG